MFSVGDKAVHPKHGAGVIESIEQEKVGGVVREYYIFRMTVGAMTLKIPTSTADQMGMRTLISEQEADRLIADLTAMKVDADMNWSRRYRENLEKLKSGDLRVVGGVIKELVHRDWKKGLSTGERKILHAARHMIVSELAMVKGISPSEAEKVLGRAVAVERKGELCSVQ